MYHSQLSCEPHSELQRTNPRCVRGRFLPILAVLGILVWADQSLASCSHYVQDRLHPAGAGDRSEADFSWRQPSEHQPCHGPGCRAPQFPSVPASVAVVLVPEIVRVGAVPVPLVFSFEHPSRPSFDRPRSDLEGHSPISSILKPPC